MAGSEIHPDWSPDGGRIAFVRQTPEGPVELWVVDVDGTTAERLYECDVPCNQVDFPDWSPDGSSIYFSQDGDVPQGGRIPQASSIGRFDLAGGATSVIISRDDGMTVWQPRVSPDGTTLAYLAGSEELGTAIFVSPVGGGPEVQLTEYEMLGAHPDWTPDGRIVFHTYDLALFPSLSEPANLFRMDADGSNLEQLTNFTESGMRAAQPRVAPDGSGWCSSRLRDRAWGRGGWPSCHSASRSRGGSRPTQCRAPTHSSGRPMDDRL
jgi:Tol biopolymer transport system component